MSTVSLSKVNLAKTPLPGRHMMERAMTDAPTRAAFSFDPDYCNGGFGRHENVNLPKTTPG